MPHTRAPALLGKWLKKKHVSQQVFAERLGLNQSSVSNWLREITRPDETHQEIIETITGISRDSWMTTEERRERDAKIKHATGDRGAA
jgi:transcriptional regulator with XRE-family HTH domain